MISDADFMLAVLRETPDEWVSQATILQRSTDARGCGMTPHSRASDLRARGHVIENRCERVGTRVISFYRLVTASLNEPSDSACDGFDGSLSEDGLARPEASSADTREPSPSPESEARPSLDSQPEDGMLPGEIPGEGLLSPHETPSSGLTLFDASPPERARREPAWR